MLPKVHTELGNAEAALSDFDTAIQQNPDLAEAFGNRGILRSQLGKPELALTDLQQAAELFKARGDQQGYQQTLYFIQQVQQAIERGDRS